MNNPDATWSNLKAGCKRAGITLPKALTDSMTKLTAVSNDGGPAPAREQLVHAYATAVAEGRNPLKDKAVIEAVQQHALSSDLAWGVMLRDWVAGRSAELLRKHADDVLVVIAERVAEAGAVLDEARPQLDATRPLAEQAIDVARAGGARSEAYRQVTDAVAVIDQATDAAHGLLYTLGHQARNLRLLLRVPDVPAAASHSIAPGTDAWALVTEHGLTITGATLPQIRAAQARIVQEEEAAAAEWEQRQKEANGKQFRFR